MSDETYKLRIGRKFTHDPSMVMYHTTFQLVDHPSVFIEFPLSSINNKEELPKLTVDQLGLVLAIFQIKGIVKIFLYPYELDVRKAPLFDWEDIDTPVIEKLKKFSRYPNEVDVVEMTQTIPGIDPDSW